MKAISSVFLTTLFAGASIGSAKANALSDDCIAHNLKFVVKEGDNQIIAVKDDIAQDLAKIGITLETVLADATEYEAYEESGDYNLLFGRTWGAPYDPHSYMASWKEPSHFEHKSTLGMKEPLSQERMLQLIGQAEQESDYGVVAETWKEVLEGVHAQAIFYPLWGTRNPAVINRRLYGFTPSSQAYSYPLTTVQIGSGSTTVTVAPGFGDSLFNSAGPIHPHQYSPNNMNMQAWVYEGEFNVKRLFIIYFIVHWRRLATRSNSNEKGCSTEPFKKQLRQSLAPSSVYLPVI